MHWTLAASVLGCLVLPASGQPHQWLGYVALAVAAVRTALGFVGPPSMRWGRFVRRPSAVLAYARLMFSGDEPRHQDHNPVGGWMVLLLLASALAAAGSGALFVTDAFWGVGWLAESHEFAGTLFWFWVPLHVGGVLMASYRHRENLVAAMIDGRKQVSRPGVPD